MIYDEDDVLEPISGKTKRRCLMGDCKNYAAWMTAPMGGNEPVPMCGWCVLYGGSTWGHERRDEIVIVGRTARASAFTHRRKTTHVPQLDERGRLDLGDSEKFLLGVKYMTHVIKNGPLGKAMARRTKAEDEASSE